MPDENRDEYGNQNDDDDAERCGASAISVFDYNRAISHTGSRSFQVTAPRYTHSRQALTHRRRMHVRMWAALGLILALFTAIFAYVRSRRAPSNYYEADVYGMTPRLHRRYASVSLLFAAAFAVSFFVASIPSVPVLGGFAVLFIFYFSTFLRGFSDEE